MTLESLPLYKSHKFVRAAPIVFLTDRMGPVSTTGNVGRPGMTRVVLSVKGAGPLDRLEVDVPDAVFARGRPNPGDWLVAFEGGWIWLPRAAFEGVFERDHA